MNDEKGAARLRAAIDRFVAPRDVVPCIADEMRDCSPGFDLEQGCATELSGGEDQEAQDQQFATVFSERVDAEEKAV